MDYESAVREARKMSGLGVFREGVPDQELVCTHPEIAPRIHRTDDHVRQQPGPAHKEATDWRVVLHEDDRAKNLGDLIRQAAAAGHVDDALTAKARALGDVDRLRLWGWSTREGITQDAMMCVHRCLTPVVMDVFKVPMGEAGIGVAPTVSRELNDFWSKKDPSWNAQNVKVRDD